MIKFLHKFFTIGLLLIFGVCNLNAQLSLIKTYPTNGNKLPQFEKQLKLTFNDLIYAGEGSIQIVNKKSGETFNIYAYEPIVSIKDSVVSINIENTLDLEMEYYVLIDPDAFSTVDNIYFDGILSESKWKFNTASNVMDINSIHSKEPSFFPNPATTEIKLTNMDKVVSLHISNLTGRNIMEVKSPDTRISINNLPKGMYFVTFISDDGNRITKKLLKR